MKPRGPHKPYIFGRGLGRLEISTPRCLLFSRSPSCARALRLSPSRPAMTGRPPPYARSPARRQAFSGDEHPPPAMLGPPPPLVDSSAGRGVCIMSASWRDKQRPDLVNFVAAFLATNLYRLNFMALSPDFIFSHGGQSVAFIFETDWLPEREAAVFSRVSTLKRQFKYLYVVVVVRSAEQNESFNQSYFKYGMELGCPTFVPVCDPEMGFEKIVRIAHARGVCKQKDTVAAMRTEREQAVQCMDAFLRVVTSIPGIDSHDANALAQAIGSIEAIAKASKESILENTDLSTEKAERIVRFFRDPRQNLIVPSLSLGEPLN